ncbi:hypothetical protein PTKIN_Ptkin18bG0030000 [Pterospermum kingtungense]
MKAALIDSAVYRIQFYLTSSHSFPQNMPSAPPFYQLGGVDNDAKAYRIYGWISFALRRRVQELDLNIFIKDLSDILPASLFTSKTLVKLVLQVSTFVLTIPTKVCLPSLKTLCLDRVNFADDDSIRRLFSGCLVLEELAICHSLSDKLSEINISSPFLKRLTLEYDHECGGAPDPDIVINAPSLVNIKFSYMLALAESCLLVNLHFLVKAHLEYLFDVEFNLEFAANLLKGISNVQSLCVTADFLRPFTLCGKPLPVFHNLVHLEIGDRDSTAFEENELIEFLASSPNLETLIFVGTAFECVTLKPSKKVPSCLLSRLEVIEIYSFRGQIKPVEYFLKNARVLAKLKIQMDLQVEEQFEIAKKLLILRKESKKCRVEIV